MAHFKNKKLLIVAPHPDDEIFGCGGLIHKIKRQGGKVYVLYLTVGTTQDFSKRNKSTMDQRAREITRVAQFLKIDGYRLAFPGNEYHLQLDALPQKKLIHEIERGEKISIEAIRPDILAIPSSFDYNQDHRAANRAAITATRPVPPLYKHFVSTVIEYEFPYVLWSSDVTLPSPNYFLPLSEAELKTKLRALRLYASQLKVKKGPLSVHGAKTLARMRGIASGAIAAEAFVLRRSCM